MVRQGCKSSLRSSEKRRVKVMDSIRKEEESSSTTDIYFDIHHSNSFLFTIIMSDTISTMSIPKTFKSLRFIGVRGKLDVHQMPSFIPVPSDEIIVKVKAASINPVDVQLWGSGLVAVVPGDAGMGKDFSGTVVAVGKNVTGWAEGDDIFGLFFDTVSA